MKKNLLFAFASFAVVGSAMGVLGYAIANNVSVPMEAAGKSYTLTLDSENIAARTSSIQSFTQTVLTTSGAELDFYLNSVSERTGGIASMYKGSYLCNSTCITGIVSIKANFSNYSTMALFYSSTPSMPSTPKTLNSGVALSLPATTKYFRLQALSSTYLASVEITYTCVESSSSSSSKTSSSSSSTSSSEPSWNNYYQADSAITDEINYKKMNKGQECDAIDTNPGKKLELLCIPVELADYPFSSSIKTDLDHALNGAGASDTGYWESLASFYKKSSYGALDLHYTVADTYKLSYTASSLAKRTLSNANDISQMVLREAVANYKSKKGTASTKAFDAEGDGLIDGVIMVYSCPDYSQSSVIASISEDLYWAYCYWDWYTSPNVSSPIGNNYFWMSYDFLYENTTAPAVDPHTLIHESGHMMGLDDYYSYDQNHSPIGWLDMMDGNIGDHNAFSKTVLGWTSPYVVTGNAKITLRPFESSGDCIIIKDGWNGTAFDEYLIMELYTPTGLNKLDAEEQYYGRPYMYQKPGVKLIHVDARMYKIKKFGSDSGQYVSTLPSSLDDDPYYYYGVAATNSYERDAEFMMSKGFDLVRLICADKSTDLYKSRENYASDSSLFHTGGSFDMTTYKAFFPNGTKLNDGSTLGYKIKFDSVTATGASITIEKA